MLIESKVRAEFDNIWSAATGPVRKARKFLALSNRLSGLARHLANLGFSSSTEENPTSRKLLWASAAKFLHYAQQARDYARLSLQGRRTKMGFDYEPQKYATPAWSDAQEKVAPPFEVTP